MRAGRGKYGGGRGGWEGGGVRGVCAQCTQRLGEVRVKSVNGVARGARAGRAWGVAGEGAWAGGGGGAAEHPEELPTHTAATHALASMHHMGTTQNACSLHAVGRGGGWGPGYARVGPVELVASSPHSFGGTSAK